jgi:ABC-2 type transport system ATP-binding protein
MNSAERAPILEAIEISKSYGARLAVDHVSLAVKPGEIAGLLGPNGAGKTTTLSILSTLMRPDHGRVLIDGKPPMSDPRVLGRMLGLVPQSLALYPTLSAAQNLWHFARMQGLSYNEAREACPRVLDEVGLSERADDPMQSFSGGMKRRLNLACGIVHGPSALMLDEPTVGVDLESREQILSMVRRRAKAGAAVIYSTHYMEEAERICDRVLPDNWIQNLTDVHEIAESSAPGRLALEMKSVAQVPEILQLLRAANLSVLDFNVHSPNLADAFIALTGRNLRDNV